MSAARRAGRARRRRPARSVRSRHPAGDRSGSGLPALIKASAGGGGKGMRHVTRRRRHRSSRFRRRGAKRPPRSATARYYVERLVGAPAPRRSADLSPTITARRCHLFERDCSTQRRHQKVHRGKPVASADAGAARAMTDGCGRRRASRELSATPARSSFMVDGTVLLLPPK